MRQDLPAPKGLPVMPVQPVPRDRKALWVLPAPRVPLARLGPRVFRMKLAPPVLKGLWVLPVLPVRKVPRVPLVLPVPKGPRGLLVLPVLKVQ